MFSGADVYRPSFFEMVAADRLVTGLQPALKHICAVVGRQHRLLAPLSSYAPEVFALLHLALERHYLAEHDASFSEYFYGLKRIHVTTPLPPALAEQVRTSELYSTALFGAEAVQAAARSGAAAGAGAVAASSTGATAVSALPPGSTSFFRPLSGSDRRRALFFLVVLPWAKGRLDGLYLRARDGVDEEGFQQAPHVESEHGWLYNQSRRLFLALYPWAHLLYEGGTLAANLLFLFEASVFASPWLLAQAQVVRRMSMADMMAPARGQPAATDGTADQLEFAWPLALHLRVLRFVRSALRSSSAWLGRYAKYGVLLAVFAFKFAEWWYSPANSYYSPNAAGGAGGINGGRKLPVPPPPKRPLPAAGAAGATPLPDEPSLCPLCLQERENPAATPDGYVFCYTCIHQHVQSKHTCPITLRPCELPQLRKIYDDEN